MPRPNRDTCSRCRKPLVYSRRLGRWLHLQIKWNPAIGVHRATPGGKPLGAAQ